LLLLDANVVIYLHEIGIWKKLIAVCDVHLAQTVVDNEAIFYEDAVDKHYIDLSDDVDQNTIQVLGLPLAEINRFRQQFDPLYIGELDPGETESLAYLTQAKEEFLISSGDAIVYRVLGRLNRSDQGISLEEVLQKAGLQQSEIPWACSKAFRERHTKQGEIDSIQSIGLKRKKT